MATNSWDKKLDEALGIKSSKNETDKLKKQLEANNKIRENYLKKYNLTEEQLVGKHLANLQKLQEKHNQKVNKQTLADKKKLYDEEAEYAIAVSDKVSARLKSALTSFGSQIAQNTANSIKAAGRAMNSTVDQYIGTYSQYMSGINARLQGYDKSYTQIANVISTNLAGSPYVRQTQVLENLSSLVKQGIAYNVEYRSFLQTIKDSIAETFDAANGTLLRLIRIQQADSTAARLGLEAYMTRFLNQQFGDSTYLSGLSDVVSGNILEATSQLNRNQAFALESNVQSWLGSLSSVGVSDSTIANLAQGLGYLGSGNINALSGNTALQNLLVMGASRAGLNYGSILSEGLTSTTSNRLLKSVIEFGQEIAKTNNEVVKAQYAAVFGLTVSDLTSLLNLTAEQLNMISKSSITYGQGLGELESQIRQVPGRLSMKERIDNVVSNVMAAAGEGIATSSGQYVAWTLASLLENAGGLNINIPFLGPVDLAQAARTGIAGFNILAKAPSILSGIFSGGGLGSNWGQKDFINRGGTKQLSTNVSSYTSQAAYLGNTDSSAIYESSLANATEAPSNTVTSTETSDLDRVIKEDINFNVLAIKDYVVKIYNQLSFNNMNLLPGV